MPRSRPRFVALILAALVGSTGFVLTDPPPVAAATFSWQDIGPDTDDGGRNAASGGRVSYGASSQYGVVPVGEEAVATLAG